MSGIASVVSSKFISRMFAATVSLQTFYPLNMIGLTGAFALVGASSSAAQPLYSNYRTRPGVVGYSRGISGLSIGTGGGLSIGPTRSMSIAPSSGARPSGVSSGPSGSVRAIKSTSGSQLSPSQINAAVSGPKNLRRYSAPPKTTPFAANPTSSPAPAISANPRTGPIGAEPMKTSAPNGEAGRNTGSQAGFDRQSPVLQGGGPGNQEGPIRDSAVFRDSSGATSSRQGTGVGRDKSTASRDAKSVSRDNTPASGDGKTVSRDKASASQDGKATSRDKTTASSDGKSASSDGAVASRDGAGGSTLKADDIRRAIDRCAQTYVSYDRVTMTYLDLNGDKQSCP